MQILIDGIGSARPLRDDSGAYFLSFCVELNPEHHDDNGVGECVETGRYMDIALSTTPGPQDYVIVTDGYGNDRFVLYDLPVLRDNGPRVHRIAPMLVPKLAFGLIQLAYQFNEVVGIRYDWVLPDRIDVVVGLEDPIDEPDNFLLTVMGQLSAMISETDQLE